MRVISSPSSSTTGFFTLIFLIAEDAILRCPIAELSVFATAGAKLAVGRRAEAAVAVGDLAEEVGEAKHLVAKPQVEVVGLVSRAKRAERSTEEVTGLMVEVRREKQLRRRENNLGQGVEHDKRQGSPDKFRETSDRLTCSNVGARGVKESEVRRARTAAGFVVGLKDLGVSHAHRSSRCDVG